MERRFRVTIVKQGGRCYVPLPFDPSEVWGSKERHSVRGTINGCAIRGAVEEFGGVPGLSLGAVWRRDNGVDVGSEVEAVLFPEGPQSNSVAPDFADAMRAEPEAARFFDSLPTFYRNNYVRWVESAKRPETRAKRILETTQLLKAGKRER